MTAANVRVDGGDLAATFTGTGEPLLIVQTALSVDELVPLMSQPELRDRFRIVTFDRRGYGSSHEGGRPGSVHADAHDCLEVLTAFDALPAHVFGVSYSGAVALDLAATHPETVLTLTVAEPPPVHAPDGQEFLEANASLLATYEREGTATALDQIMTRLAGPDWRARQERLAPGSVARIERDARSFFERDIPALMSWEFGSSQAIQVTAPVMYVGGTHSGRWFAQARSWMQSMFPQMRVLTIDGAEHDLALTHSEALGAGIASFIKDVSELR